MHWCMFVSVGHRATAHGARCSPVRPSATGSDGRQTICRSRSAPQVVRLRRDHAPGQTRRRVAAPSSSSLVELFVVVGVRLPVRGKAPHEHRALAVGQSARRLHEDKSAIVELAATPIMPQWTCSRLTGQRVRRSAPCGSDGCDRTRGAGLGLACSCVARPSAICCQVETASLSPWNLAWPQASILRLLAGSKIGIQTRTGAVVCTGQARKGGR
jgi:hypothetical protein